MIVEDKILEYLDGSLGEHESAELLETLAVSPEKRALLDEHLRLKEILALGRKPYSVPMATERSLAERIPILSRPDVVTSPTGFRGVLQGARLWTGKRAFQTAMGVAAIIAVSAVAWFAMQPSRTATNGALSNSGNSNTSHVQSTQLPPAAEQPSLPKTNSLAAAAAGHREQLAHLATMKSQAGNTAVRDIQDANGVASEMIRSAATAAPAQPSPKIDGKPLHSVTNFSQNDILIPRESNQSHTLSQIEQGEIEHRGTIAIGANLSLDQSYLPQAAGIAAQSPFAGQPSITLDYDISDNFAIGIEAGREIYASVTEQNRSIQVTSNYSNANYWSTIDAVQAYYYCLTTHYTINPESEYPIRLGLSGGIASTGEPAAMATAGISRTLSENLLLDLDAVFSGIWGTTPQQGYFPPPSGGVEGIVRQDVSQQKTFTTGIGVRAGLRFIL